MCTVSFIPNKESFIITSNRDEHISRPRAFKPNEVTINGRKIVFPKDPKAGGTWFAMNENGVVVVLLNGAFKKHTPKGNYAKSRGLIVLDVVGHENPQQYLEAIALENIEPFTILVVQEGKLKELRWDGKEKFIKKLDSSLPHIWSSATLYEEEVILKRQTLFSEFISTNTITERSIIDFHTNVTDDLENGFVIERTTGLKTFSVTQAVLTSEKVILQHIDLQSKTDDTVEMRTNQLMDNI